MIAKDINSKLIPKDLLEFVYDYIPCYPDFAIAIRSNRLINRIECFYKNFIFYLVV